MLGKFRHNGQPGKRRRALKQLRFVAVYIEPGPDFTPSGGRKYEVSALAL
jgi:hypothetical protein